MRYLYPLKPKPNCLKSLKVYVIITPSQSMINNFKFFSLYLLYQVLST